MKHKFEYLESSLEQIRRDNLTRRLRYGKIKGSEIVFKNKTFLNLCSNDYLGIPPSKIQNSQLQSSSRLVSGNTMDYEKLEKRLASHKSQKRSLIFPTGYMTNLGVISSLIEKNDLILSDELNHASIIEASKLTEAKISIYNHNHMEDLRTKLKANSKRRFIITEGIFSMDGDLANLKEITELAEKHDAILILDDAHGDFVMGRDGKGTANHFQVSKKIDVYISSLSKALGSFGGYVASNNQVVDFCINKSKSFIYTSALPSSLIKYSLDRINLDQKKYRKRLESNRNRFVKGLKSSGFNIESKTHIIPIIIGNEKTAMEFGDFIFKNGLFAQPIRYPTVKKNRARLRISITSWLSNKQIDYAIEILEKAAKKYKVI
ncbi:MAG: pyridoxal phosphate-dependent aminotransferase family protein [Crenarchaeota archaeon]|nr:MAG: pyridoxal phosphate-dependent aminotransferase family protein [Thermoproteota archaeon]RDJ34129.1 MAG: pyridoxal phosphate-dependent aminotransferase family protein [Thermoproteota archaeon]RDJ36755.1 MAG: pyridoxal phosphate-dependent aminotransferase family protein [Thermoproteota archaeon]RDJ37711.1 MAG: pyridoxal phosphate-dependent aminotransferase family protein [Thermoproteota archaeon]